MRREMRRKLKAGGSSSVSHPAGESCLKAAAAGGENAMAA